MKCPLCHVELTMSERHGVEIDYCPKCRGVWLDRGELDKIIEKATEPMVLPNPEPAPQPRVRQEPYRQERGYSKGKKYSGRRDHDRDDDDRYRKKKRRKSILAEIFDFD